MKKIILRLKEEITTEDAFMLVLGLFFLVMGAEFGLFIFCLWFFMKSLIYLMYDLPQKFKLIKVLSYFILSVTCFSLIIFITNSR